jgi:hypothetical protein
MDPLLTRPARAAVYGALLTVSVATFGLEGLAHASDRDEAPQSPSGMPEPRAYVAWGVRPNFSGGFAGTPDGNGPTGRVGIDAEYWLSENVGVGVQLGLEYLTTLNVCGGSRCTDAKATRASLAPAIAVRGNGPTSFPMASLALGYAWGHSEAGTTEDVGYVRASGWASDAAVPYSSLTAAWLFRPQQVRAGSSVFEFGPLVRLDFFPFADSVSTAFSSGSFAWAFMGGFTLGLGRARQCGE